MVLLYVMTVLSWSTLETNSHPGLTMLKKHEINYDKLSSCIGSVKWSRLSNTPFKTHFITCPVPIWEGFSLLVMRKINKLIFRWRCNSRCAINWAKNNHIQYSILYSNCNVMWRTVSHIYYYMHNFNNREHICSINVCA